MKHMHMLMAFLLLFLFIIQAMPILTQKGSRSPAIMKVCNHLLYALVMASGFWLFWQLYQVAGVQHWAIAKLVLLIVAASATAKAQRNHLVASGQAKAGLLIATVAYVGIVFLAFAKPMLI
ncbi:SirB2 family protein [Moraxella sp. Tifton1]|uniref:SirB2 family protein n=1 Tax=Moraxella oculi TaxID=2940516 RepID=UPI002013228F|nr:SirB2 family protein [Moraxella sp. Tifton1]MCL1623191.1 SirB2 family protein [Moraxella sp. Tifton1]